jgi:hypothetical protein
MNLSQRVYQKNILAASDTFSEKFKNFQKKLIKKINLYNQQMLIK